MIWSVFSHFVHRNSILSVYLAVSFILDSEIGIDEWFDRWFDSRIDGLIGE